MSPTNENYRNWIPILLTVCAGAAPLSATQSAAKEPALRPPPMVPLHLQAQERELARFDRVRMAVPEVPTAFERIELPIEGQWVTLDLRLRSNRSDSFEVLAHREDGSYERVRPLDPGTFRGSILELKGSQVAGAFLPTGLEARILLEDGRTLGIEPDFEAFSSGDRQTYLVYDLADAAADTWQCQGAALVPAPSDQQQQLGTGCGSAHCRTELALDLDYGFYEDYDYDYNLAVAMAENIVNVVNVIYEREVGIRHDLTTIVVRTSLASEPPGYASSANVGAFLGAFRDWWVVNHTGIHRDVAHGITGRHTGGMAWIYSEGDGVICDTGWGFGASGSAYDPYVRSIANVVAHELGHNWGAGHCTCASPAYIMNPYYPPCALRHHPVESIPDILTEKGSVACIGAGVVGDDFEDAMVMSLGTVIGSTVGATNDGSASCGSSGSSPDVWYRYTPSFSGAMLMATCGTPTNFDTVLSLYGWNGAAFTELACNDDNCNLSSRLGYDVIGGYTYYIRVAGYNGATGTFELALLGPRDEPVNDRWQDAIDIGPGFQVGNTAMADLDVGTDFCAYTNGAPDVWYRYRPMMNSPVLVDLCAASYDTVLSVFDVPPGGAPEASNIIACNDDWCGLGSRVEWDPIGGHDYLIRVSGYNSQTGSFRLGLTGPDTLDELCNVGRELAAGAHWISLKSAYEVQGSSSCGPLVPRPDRWFLFTAPAAGTITAKTCGSNDALGVDLGVDTVLSWHQSCPGTASNELACSDDYSSCAQLGSIRDSEVTIPVVANQVRYLRLSPYFPGYGDLVRLEIGFDPANDDCSGAIDVGLGTLHTWLTGATNDGASPCAGGSNPDLWYRFTAPESGRLRVTTCGTNDLPGVDLGLDTVLSLHPTCPGTADNTIACNDDSGACSNGQGSLYDSVVEMTIAEGQSVLIRVTTYDASTDGQFLLNIELQPNGAKVPR